MPQRGVGRRGGRGVKRGSGGSRGQCKAEAKPLVDCWQRAEAVWGRTDCHAGVALGWGGGEGLATPTETNVRGDALRFVGKTWARHKTIEPVLNNGWRLVAVGGGWRLVVPGGCP